MTPVCIIDIEAVVDADLVEAAEGKTVEEYRAGLQERTGKDDPFVPYSHYRPIVLAGFMATRTISKAFIYRENDAETITARWWRSWQASQRKRLTRIVTWGGKWFDLPLLEMMAMRERIALPGWLLPPGSKPWDDPRHQSSGAHVDLCDWMCNRGAAPRMPMATAAAALGFPGKLGVSGADVAGMYQDGRLGEIAAYCATDVLTLLGLYLRMMNTTGEEIDEDEIIKDAVRQFSELDDATAEAVGRWVSWPAPF